MRRFFAPLLLVVLVSGAVGAGPDRTEALAKAKTKFEDDVSKAEDALLASIDKALTKAQAAGNKSATEKLTYEREQFVTRRMIPTTVPTAGYLKQRAQAVAALEAVYFPTIKELTKAKKTDEVGDLEDALSAMLKTARGYGLALPDLGARPPLLIENKETGLVMESPDAQGNQEVVLRAKIGKQKPLQCWYLNRDEKGYTIENAQTGKSFSISYKSVDEKAVPSLWTRKLDPQKETPNESLYELVETRHEVVISMVTRGELKDKVLAAVEKKMKGLTVYEAGLATKETPPAKNQLWVITEAK